MKIYLTEFRAIERKTGEFRKYAGPNIEAPTWAIAQAQCDVNYPYLTVIGELVATIDADDVKTDYNHALN